MNDLNRTEITTVFNGIMWSEQDVRCLRAAIYGMDSNKNWDGCRHGWMTLQSIQWLIDHQPKKS